MEQAMGFDYKLIDKDGFEEYRSWFSDKDLRNWVQPPTDIWYEYVRSTPRVRDWLIYHDKAPVAHIQFERIGDGIGSVSLVVKPELRYRGFGRRVLQSFLLREEIQDLKSIDVEIEPDNEPAQHCVLAAGFTQRGEEPDEDGFLRFVYAFISAS